MRIAHFMVGIQEPGGVSTYIARVGRAQQARGHEVTYVDLASDRPTFQGQAIIQVGDPGRLHAEMQRAQVELIHLHCHFPPSARRAVPSIRTVHNNGAYCLSGEKFLNRRGVPCPRPYSLATCLVGHAIDRCGSLRPSKLMANLQRIHTEFALLRKVRSIAVSDYVRVELVRAGHDEKLIETLHSPAPEMPSTAVLSAGRAPRVLFAGRLCLEKGIFWLLDAIRMLNGRVHLDIAGAGPEEDRARLACARLGMEGYVRFHGWRTAEEMANLLQSNRALVFPSLWQEPAGLVALEAMAAGRPVIASRVGGIPEVVQHGVNGLLVSPNDGPGLARAIETVVTDDEMAVAMGQAGRSMALDRFTMSGHLDSLDRSYQSAVNAFGTGNS